MRSSTALAVAGRSSATPRSALAAQARIRARISVRNRKRRTRCLILIGSYMEHVTQTDPDLKARLMKGLDGFLERDRDRELFDFPPRLDPDS